jgi:septal ring factor EnvC (AmiA/AmiB activator)
VHPFELAVWAFLRAASAPAPPDNTLLPILLALMTGGLLASVVTWLRFRQQGNAEKENIIAEAASRAVETMREALEVQARRIRDLEQEVQQLQDQLDRADDRVRRLQEALKTAADRSVAQAEQLVSALETRERLERRLHAAEERLAELIARPGGTP